MLNSLDIRDILIIDRLTLSFQPGLNALTGETGAGKSILLDSLGFVLGWRGRAELVRAGADQGEVTASFHLSDGHAGVEILAEAGIEIEDGEVILRRINTKDGRKTAWINDRRVSGDVLRKLSDTLVELHGQHDDRGLLNPRGHRVLLDNYANVASELDAVRTAWHGWRSAEKALAKANAEIELAKSEEEYLRHAVGELDALSPEVGEEAALDSQRRMMQAAEKISADVQKARHAIGLQGAEGQITDAMSWLQAAVEHAQGTLDESLAALETAAQALDDAQQGVADCLERLSFNPFELEEAEDRLFAIRALARKHDILPDELTAFGDELRSKLAVLDGSATDIADLEVAVGAARDAYEKASATLTAKRTVAAKKLDKAMAQELGPLKMDRAVFTTQITATPAGIDGSDAVAFEVATNPGAPSGPIDKIASGGELSRFLLALKVCLTSHDSGLTMIFDEIDRGVGGATADAVGRRLSSLAQDGQILVVTHSPQVAALAQHHWRVEKKQTAATTLSTVSALDDDARINEIARMISGDHITDAARDAARALMS